MSSDQKINPFSSFSDRFNLQFHTSFFTDYAFSSLARCWADDWHLLLAHSTLNSDQLSIFNHDDPSDRSSLFSFNLVSTFFFLILIRLSTQVFCYLEVIISGIIFYKYFIHSENGIHDVKEKKNNAYTKFP